MRKMKKLAFIVTITLIALTKYAKGEENAPELINQVEKRLCHKEINLFDLRKSKDCQCEKGQDKFHEILLFSLGIK